MLLPRNVASWIALALMAMASPPFAWVVDVFFLVTFFTWFIAASITRPSWARLRFSAATVLFLSAMALSASELAHRKTPLITGAPSNHLVVIGDSISSGIDPRAPAWPTVFGQMTGVSVKNLAKPGATVADGLAMAGQITPRDYTVLIEVGGNDLLSGTSSAEFGRNLELLLSKLAVPGRTVVMFELPLWPNAIAYGRIQRRLASKYGVWLIPKHYFVRVIGGANATLDGLHLSESGAHQMALLVARVLSPVLKSSAFLPNSPRSHLAKCPSQSFASC
jgi:lysophospholipase L1-like esterase